MNNLLNSYNLNKAVLQEQELLFKGQVVSEKQFKIEENINKIKFAGLAIMVLESDIITSEDKKTIIKLLVMSEYAVAMKLIDKYVS